MARPRRQPCSSDAPRGPGLLVFLAPDAPGRDGFVESATAQAELNYGGDFVFSASYIGRFAAGDDVMFSVRQLHRPVGSV